MTPRASTEVARRALPVSPLLKWVGGKRQLLPRIRSFYPPVFGAYFEPFFGSGAVFFDLWHAGRLQTRQATLLDSNSDLVGCYEMVRDRTADVLAALEGLADGHAREGQRHYYAVRDERFNPLRDQRREADGRIPYTAELAAMLIYLNRTGFNGLYRVNASGQFNVPAGRYAKPNIVDRDRLERVAAVLRDPAVELRHGHFAETLQLARTGDFLYFDPPYAPMSETASFTAYTAPGFGASDQSQLQRVIIALAQRGCHVLLSNSTSDVIGGLYEGNPEAAAAGLRTYRVPARRAVNSVPSRRGVIDEFLISNVEPSG